MCKSGISRGVKKMEVREEVVICDKFFAESSNFPHNEIFESETFAIFLPGRKFPQFAKSPSFDSISNQKAAGSKWQMFFCELTLVRLVQVG